MRFYFVRHGQAVPFASSDEARPLTDKGIQQAKNNGIVLSQMGVSLARIYCSPRVRAQQTAQYIGEALGLSPIVDEACNFDFTYEKALALAEGLAEDAQVMFVGHNPSMSGVVQMSSGARVSLSTGAMACVDGAHVGYPEYATLKWLLTPKVVRHLLNFNNS